MFKKAVIIAPFWRLYGHIGNLRINRFLRILSGAGYEVVIIRAGSSDAVSKEEWGEEVTIRDPLGLYRDESGYKHGVSARKPNKLRRLIASWAFNPDAKVVWAQRVAKHTLSKAAVENAEFILSSSPPESVHVAAYKLSKKYKIPHVMDMRDGWLDEPLKPLLRHSALRRMIEGRLEKNIFLNASIIQVTSETWQRLLVGRFPHLSKKIVVLTNGYPVKTIEQNEAVGKLQAEKKGLVLVHAGRFTGSDPRRHLEILLAPLLTIVAQIENRGTIRLLGDLTEKEEKIVQEYIPPLSECGWILECPGDVPQDKLAKELFGADGLLMLTVTNAQLPGKLFEYIPTTKPLMILAGRGSATWELCRSLPQAYMLEIGGESQEAGLRFMNAASTGDYEADVPDAYSEKELGKKFLSAIRCSTKMNNAE